MGVMINNDPLFTLLFADDQIAENEGASYISTFCLEKVKNNV